MLQQDLYTFERQQAGPRRNMCQDALVAPGGNGCGDKVEAEKEENLRDPASPRLQPGEVSILTSIPAYTRQ